VLKKKEVQRVEKKVEEEKKLKKFEKNETKRIRKWNALYKNW
jgi:hypothetical protein